jgi:LPXTG-site transpeptidase (sortase) family protein
MEPLQNGVGHLFSTPGGGGKVLIYGHSSGYPWDKSQYTKIFRKINELQTGDKVYVTYDGKLNVYEVTYEESVPASDTSRYNDDGKGEELILYTCWPPDSISQRYLVHAVPVQKIALR